MLPQPVDRSCGEIWTAIAARLGCDEPVARRTGADLESRYAEPHRRYHTGAHVQAVDADATELALRLNLDPHEFDVLIAAVCAHDVVYDARPGDDERASAAWAVSALTSGGVHAGTADRIADLVLMTISHDAPAHDHIAQALLDADLAILAAAPQRYADYVAGVRAEYAHVPDADWLVGRAAVLRGLLGRTTIYHSSPGRQSWETAARANVAAELATLEAPA